MGNSYENETDKILRDIEELLIQKKNIQEQLRSQKSDSKSKTEDGFKSIIKRLFIGNNASERNSESENKYPSYSEIEKQLERRLDTLIGTWISIAKDSTWDYITNIKTPPIIGVHDDKRCFLNFGECLTGNYSENNSFEAYNDHIRFYLINNYDVIKDYWFNRDEPEGHVSILSYEKDEDRAPLYLNNETRYAYLKECLKYIDDINNLTIFRYKAELSFLEVTRTIKGFGYGMWGVDSCSKMLCHSYTLTTLHHYLHCKKRLITNELNIIALGLEGERLVNSYLEMYDDEIINLPNVRLEVEGNSIENDNILLTPYGIYILEVKNLGSKGSYSLKISKDGKWSKIFKNGSSEAIEYNASTQNERHIRYLQRYINNILNKSIDDKDYLKVSGLVIISNEEVDIVNESEQPVYRMSEIYRQISKQEKIFTRQDLLNLKDIILKDSLEEKVYQVNDYLGELEDNYSVFYSQISCFNDNVHPKAVIYMCLWVKEFLTIMTKIQELEKKYNQSLLALEPGLKMLTESEISYVKSNLENLGYDLEPILNI